MLSLAATALSYNAPMATKVGMSRVSAPVRMEAMWFEKAAAGGDAAKLECAAPPPARAAPGCPRRFCRPPAPRRRPSVPMGALAAPHAAPARATAARIAHAPSALTPLPQPSLCRSVYSESLAGAGKKQDFLEASPYWDQSGVPVNTYKNKTPFKGNVISTKRIVGVAATGETTHIIINHDGKMPYWEGQSYGVIPPGENPKKPGKPNTVRLYSIASSRYGDDMTGNTASLVVKRAVYWDPDTQTIDPAKKGICSNFLCDSTPGTELSLTGPSGKVMLMPEEKKDTDLIMVATGTGIAPYRSFLRRLFVEKTPFAADYKGIAWLFLGVANSDALLYDDEWQAIKEAYPNNFRLDYALSREQTNKKGGKMYIQDKVEEYSDEIFDRLDKGAHIYFCGLKGMMPGINDMLEAVCKTKKLDFKEKQEEWKKKGQWHVEVY